MSFRRRGTHIKVDLRALPPGTTIPDRLLADVRVMLAHALSTGRQVSPQWVDTVVTAEREGVDAAMLRRLTRVHDELAPLVAPATPRSLAYLESVRGADSGRRAVPLVRWLIVLAVVFTAAFIGLATRSDVGGVDAGFEDGSGLTLFVNLLFLVASAGMGATFAGLFAANRHVNDFSFDPRYESSYWVRILLGVTAGLILAELVPLGDEGRSFGRPLLALLGGFGVEVVYRLLQRLVDTAASLFSATPSADETAAIEKVRSDQRATKTRLELAHRLTQLRAGASDAAVAGELDGLITELGGGEPAPPVPPPVDETATPFEPDVVPAGPDDSPPPVVDTPEPAVADATDAAPDDPDAAPPPRRRRPRSG